MMLEKVDPDIAAMLMPSEEILLVASQSKTAPGGTLTSPNKIYITTHRILFKDPRLFGLKARIIDVGYADISTVMLKRGLFTTEIYLKPRYSPHKIELPAVDKKVATHASLLIQKGMRGELGNSSRARHAATASADTGAARQMAGMAASHAGRHDRGKKEREDNEEDEADNPLLLKLKKLGDMRRQGIISEQEFDVLREELMYSVKHEPATAEQGVPAVEQPTAAAATTTATATASLAEPPQPPASAAASQPLGNSLFCNSCGAPLPAGSRFCSQCGKPLQTAAN
jgi:hypothetical protein